MSKQKKRFEYKVNLGKDMNGRLIRKSFYSVKSLADAMTKMLLQDNLEAFHERSYEIAKAYLTEEVEKKWKELVG